MSEPEQQEAHRVNVPNVDPTQIVIRDLDYSIGPKHILKNVNTVFQPGRLSVILGSSGAGKTTLLSLLAGLHGAMSSSAARKGEVLLNGVHVSPEEIRKIVGFVFQDDVILETMTVKEAVEMSIKLRVNDLAGKDEDALLERMIEVSQLDKASDVIIGSPMKKGISGGERKRTAIAMELVSNPSVILLDEATSGLDTYTAYRIVALLRRLAWKHGRTVVATLHQPSSEIFHMIDDLYVLHEGELVYGGEAKDMVGYFDSAGYIFPEYSNPLDVLFMDVLNKSSNDEFSEDLGKQGITRDGFVSVGELAKHYKESDMFKERVLQHVQHPNLAGVNKSMHRYRAGPVKSFMYLLFRDMRNVFRNPMILKTKLFQTLFMAVFIALVFLNTGSQSPPALFQNLSGVMFFLGVNAFFSSFQNVLPVFSAEKASFSREHSQGYYGMTSYFVAKLLVELPLTVTFPILTGLITYWTVGLRPGIGHFFLFVLVLQMISLVGFSLGLFVACLFRDVSVALALSILFLLPVLVFGGVFVNLQTVPVFLRWFQWVSPIRYGYDVMLKNQFEGWGNAGASQYYRSIGVSTGLPVIGNLLILGGYFALGLALAYLAMVRLVRQNEGGKKLIEVTIFKKKPKAIREDGVEEIPMEQRGN